MNLWSVSFSYRLGLGFHALNNEGSDGSNLMQPRRIDVGGQTYDGISGEIVRRHILENFVRRCRAANIHMLPLSEGLHPDRGPIGIRAAAKLDKATELTDQNLLQSVRRAISDCAVLDVGGYLAAWKEQDGGSTKEHTVEKKYIDVNCSPYKNAQPVKRDSCFDVGWLISEEPLDATVTQHSTFRATAEMNMRYAQTMRSNVYAGVIRADLYRIGTDDYWYLTSQERLAVEEDEQLKRQTALIQAIGDFLAAPAGAKTAAWAPHVFLTEGAILLTSNRTAPFSSPIRVSVNSPEKSISRNEQYQAEMNAISTSDAATSSFWHFQNVAELTTKLPEITKKLSENAEANPK